jgi:hypothetical protein
MVLTSGPRKWGLGWSEGVVLEVYPQRDAVLYLVQTAYGKVMVPDGQMRPIDAVTLLAKIAKPRP